MPAGLYSSDKPSLGSGEGIVRVCNLADVEGVLVVYDGQSRQVVWVHAGGDGSVEQPLVRVFLLEDIDEGAAHLVEHARHV